MEVDENNRNIEIGEQVKIKGWTGFNFPARQKKYSDFKWHYYHFNGVDYDDLTGKKPFKTINKEWAEDTDKEKDSVLLSIL